MAIRGVWHFRVDQACRRCVGFDCNTACGATGARMRELVKVTADVTRVTCKQCMRTAAFRQAQLALLLKRNETPGE